MKTRVWAPSPLHTQEVFAAEGTFMSWSVTTVRPGVVETAVHPLAATTSSSPTALKPNCQPGTCPQTKDYISQPPLQLGVVT